MAGTSAMHHNGSSQLLRVAVFLLIAVVGTTLACNGYKLKVRKVQNCGGPDAVITAFENNTAVLTKKCELKVRGCVQYSSFKTAVAKYTIKKDDQPMMEGRIDLCQELEANRKRENFAPIFQTFNLPEKCPVEAGTLCAEPSQVVDLEPFKQFLSLARGRIDVRTEIEHDEGTSCFRVVLDITK